MKIKKFKLKVLNIVTAFLMFINILLIISCTSDQSNGYIYKILNTHDTKITKNNKTIINHHIIDVNKLSNYYIGLRMPGEYFSCKNDTLRYVISNEKEYFILNIYNGKVSKYDNKKSFIKQINSLGILDNISLDYSKFDKIWSKVSHLYDDLDLTECESLESKM